MLERDSYTIQGFERGTAHRPEICPDVPVHGGTLPFVPPVSRVSPRAFKTFRDFEAVMSKTWLIKDMIGAGELSFVYGAPGSGKSALVADLAAHVAAGKDWHGQRVEQGAVLYIAAERGAVVERRYVAWRQHHGIDDIPLALMTGHFDLWSKQDDIQSIISTLPDIRRALRGPVKWIIIDTVSRVMPGADENSGKDVGQFLANLERLREASGAHVTCVHHVPHGDQSRMRGSGVLLGAADATFSVEHDQETGARTLKSRKVSDGRDDLSFAFVMRPVTIFVDPRTGEETTAPVVVEEDARGHGGTGSNVPLTNAEEIAKRVLQNLIIDAGREPPPAFGLPKSTLAVSEDDWRNACYARKITESELANTRRKNFARAADGLQRKGLIGVREGFVWLTH